MYFVPAVIHVGDIYTGNLYVAADHAGAVDLLVETRTDTFFYGISLGHRVRAHRLNNEVAKLPAQISVIQHPGKWRVQQNTNMPIAVLLRARRMVRVDEARYGDAFADNAEPILRASEHTRIHVRP